MRYLALLIASVCLSVSYLTLGLQALNTIPAVRAVQSVAFRLGEEREAEAWEADPEEISKATIESINIVKTGELVFPSVLEYDEQAHLLDVWEYIKLLRVIFWVSLTFGLVLVKVGKLKLSRLFRTTAKIVLGTFFGIIIAIGFFQKFFLWFHEIFFPQGNWSFPSTSLLIQSFPLMFWLSELVLLLAWLGIGFLLFDLMAKTTRRTQ
jgi:integral membrane protein (TIGR01906 family)